MCGRRRREFEDPTPMPLTPRADLPAIRASPAARLDSGARASARLLRPGMVVLTPWVRRADAGRSDGVGEEAVNRVKWPASEGRLTQTRWRLKKAAAWTPARRHAAPFIADLPAALAVSSRVIQVDRTCRYLFSPGALLRCKSGTPHPPAHPPLPLIPGSAPVCISDAPAMLQAAPLVQMGAWVRRRLAAAVPTRAPPCVCRSHDLSDSVLSCAWPPPLPYSTAPCPSRSHHRSRSAAHGV